MTTLRDFVDGYRPRHIHTDAWPEIASAVRSALLKSAGTESTARRYASHLAAHVAWCRLEGIDTSSPEHLSLEAIERYIEVGMSGTKESTRATRRAILRRIARKAHPVLSLESSPSPIAYRRVRAPYTKSELAAYRRSAESQPTSGRRLSMLAVLGLGAGCGLDCGDMGWVRGVDVTHGELGLRVLVGGPRPRDVVCLAEYEDLVAQLADARGDALLIGGQRQGRHNVTSVALNGMIRDSSLPPLVVGRLRSTWLTTHLAANTPLRVIMTAAGLRTVRPLEDLIEYAPDFSEHETARLLRRDR